MEGHIQISLPGVAVFSAARLRRGGSRIPRAGCDMTPFWFKRLQREFDTRPIAAHLYVTDRCNLDCAYCTEYDNSVPHPALDDLQRWIDKIAELGCIRLGLQGGEPLDHPDIVAVVRHAKSCGMKTSLSTNGFLLTAQLAGALKDAGLDGLQLSVDGMEPVGSTRKSLKTVESKLELLEASGLRFNLTGVVFQDTLDDAYNVVKYGLDRGISSHARLIHTDPSGRFRVGRGDRDKLDAFLDWEAREKQLGRPIHTSWRILRYQKSLLRNEPVDWTCLAGYKYFFVSATGLFWLCSMKQTPGVPLLDVTPALLESYFEPKPCQDGCGVYCVISESLASSQRGRYVAERVKDAFSGLRPVS